MPAYYARPGRPRSGGRLARNPQLAADLAARLTARDRWLLRMIAEHRVLTTAQVTQLAFGTTRAATARMTTLYQYRAVDRFRPLAPAGSSPLHFILDKAGAMLLAAEDGITPADLGYRRDRSMAIALSPRLAHDTGANGIFTSLAAIARASSGRQALECWWGERRCAATWGGHARPDGYGRWTEQLPGRPAVTVDFFLEYDTGTEPLSRVVAKLAGYAALAARTGITTPVLFCLRSPSREAALHARLAGPPPPGIRDAASAAQIPGVPVATAAPGTSPQGPAGAAWLPAGSPGPRLRLAQLAPPGIAPAAAARTVRNRAARPAACPGTRRTPPRPPGTPQPASPAPARTTMTSRAARAGGGCWPPPGWPAAAAPCSRRQPGRRHRPARPRAPPPPPVPSLRQRCRWPRCCRFPRPGCRPPPASLASSLPPGTPGPGSSLPPRGWPRCSR